MTEEQAEKLYQLADLIHAVARQLGAPADLRPGPCTPVEISVMRFISRNPGSSARVAAAATRLASSNFSRVIKGLISKGLLRRETDGQDARGVRLYPTDLAKANEAQMRRAWSAALAGAAPDLHTIDLVNAVLWDIEAELALRANSPTHDTDRQT